MSSGRAKAILVLAVASTIGLSAGAGTLAAPGLYPGAETVDVKWMSGVIDSGRACVGSRGLHGHDAYDLIADDYANPPADRCSDGGVPAAVNLRTLGLSSTPHATLRATMYVGHYTDLCDYVEARTVQNPTGTLGATYRYVHATGTPGQQVDIWAGPSLLPTDTPIGSTTNDSDCQGGWEGYHTHQDSGNPTSPWSQPNLALPTDDDIPVWDPYYWIQRWTYTLPDTDGDDFQDAAEVYLGTDRLDHCPDNPPGSDDAWPLDIDKNRTITVVGDVLNYSGRLGAAPGSSKWLQRLDLNTDSVITMVGDVLKYSGRLGDGCWPP
jgi:hypothetical protein